MDMIMEELTTMLPHLISQDKDIFKDGEFCHIIWTGENAIGSTPPPGLAPIIVPDSDPWLGTFHFIKGEVIYTPKRLVMVNGVEFDSPVRLKTGDVVNVDAGHQYQLQIPEKKRSSNL